MDTQQLKRRGDALFREIATPHDQAVGYDARTKETFDELCVALALLESLIIREMKRLTPLYQWIDAIEKKMVSK